MKSLMPFTPRSSRQRYVKEEIIAKFTTHMKVLFCGACSTGKTIITINFIIELLQRNPSLRFAISTFSTKCIRGQWLDTMLERIPKEFIQVVCSTKDLKKYQDEGLPAVSNSKISKTKPITIFIPQSISTNNMGTFDYVIVDEAHVYFDIPNGTLKQIIKEHSHENTKILGLTGTGSKLILPGAFFEKSDSTVHVFYDTPMALADGIINDCEVFIEYFKFDLKNKFYSKNELNKDGRDFLRTHAIKSKKFTTLCNKVEGKTVVFVPPLMDEEMANHIALCYGSDSVVRKTSNAQNQGEDLDLNELRFRKDPKVKFMVSIYMAGIGYDFPELQNVIDLTFTKDPNIIIQRLSRTIRKHHSKNQPSHYYYCADQSKNEIFVECLILTAFELMTKEGLLNWDGKVNLVQKKRKSGKELSSSEDSIKIGSFSDYYNVDKLCHGCTHKTILRQKISMLQKFENSNCLDKVLGQFLKSVNDLNEIKKITDKFLEIKISDQRMSETNFIQKCLDWLSKEYSQAYKNFYEDDPIEIIASLRTLRNEI